MCNKPKVDVVNINAQAKLGQIPSICSQDSGNEILTSIEISVSETEIYVFQLLKYKCMYLSLLNRDIFI